MSLAYLCVLFAGILPVLTVALAKTGHPSIDNNHPRDWAQEALSGFRKRAYAAHLNHYEAFPFFAAGVLVAKQSGEGGALLNSLAIGFVAARLLYTAFYIADLSTLRSVVWAIGWFTTIAIFTLPLWR